jgi:hypothetical protein
VSRHPRYLTTEQLGEAMLETVRAMSPEEKAELRYELQAHLRMPKRVLLAMPVSDRVN